MATLGGNIVNASPISDINAIMMAIGASYELVGSDGSRTALLPQDFLMGFRCCVSQQSPPTYLEHLVAQSESLVGKCSLTLSLGDEFCQTSSGHLAL